MSSLGPVLSPQNVQIFAKMYEFLKKMNQIVPIPLHVIVIPCRDTLARKNLVFIPEEFFPPPATPALFPPKAVLGKKHWALVSPDSFFNL